MNWMRLSDPRMTDDQGDACRAALGTSKMAGSATKGHASEMHIAFTLVKFLVVIGIITLLIAILPPAGVECYTDN